MNKDDKKEIIISSDSNIESEKSRIDTSCRYKIDDNRVCQLCWPHGIILRSTFKTVNDMIPHYCICAHTSKYTKDNIPENNIWSKYDTDKILNLISMSKRKSYFNEFKLYKLIKNVTEFIIKDEELLMIFIICMCALVFIGKVFFV